MPIIKPLSSVLLVALIMSNAGWPNDAVALASRGPEAANRGTQLVDEEEDDEPPPAEPYFGQDRTTGKFIPSRVDEEPRQLVVLLHAYGQSILGIINHTHSGYFSRPQAMQDRTR